MTYQILAKLSSGQMVHVAWYLWEWRVVRRQMKGPINVFLLTDLEGGNIDSNFSYQVSSTIFFIHLAEYILNNNFSGSLIKGPPKKREVSFILVMILLRV